MLYGNFGMNSALFVSAQIEVFNLGSVVKSISGDEGGFPPSLISASQDCDIAGDDESGVDGGCVGDILRLL